MNNLKNDPAYPDSPDQTVMLTNLLEAPKGRGGNFGSRLETYITPPVTCDWIFYISSDDNGQLNLSTDTNPSNKVQIAHVGGWTSSRQWNKFPEQMSVPIRLEAGGLYYLEAMYKEGGGGDNLAIAWECLDHSITLEVIDASHTSVSVPGPPPPPPPVAQVEAAYDALGAPECTTTGTGCTSGTLLVGRASLGPEQNTPNTIDGCVDGTYGTYQNDESIEKITVRSVDGGILQAGQVAEIETDAWVWRSGSADTADFYFTANVDTINWVWIGSINAELDGGETNPKKMSVQYLLPADSDRQAVRVQFRYSGNNNTSCSGGNYDDHDDLVFSVLVDSSISYITQQTEPVPPAEPPKINCESIDNQDRCAESTGVCQWHSQGENMGCKTRGKNPEKVLRL